MGTSPSAQALELLSALVLGLGLGLGYDLLRPPRRMTGKGAAAVLDWLFALLAGAVAFLGAMGAADGRLGIWELGATLLGFLFYLYALSPLVLPLLENWYRLIFRTIRLIKKFEKNLRETAKNIFPNLKERIIMRR